MPSLTIDLRCSDCVSYKNMLTTIIMMALKNRRKYEGIVTYPDYSIQLLQSTSYSHDSLWRMFIVVERFFPLSLSLSAPRIKSNRSDLSETRTYSQCRNRIVGIAKLITHRRFFDIKYVCLFFLGLKYCVSFYYTSFPALLLFIVCISFALIVIIRMIPLSKHHHHHSGK